MFPFRFANLTAFRENLFHEVIVGKDPSGKSRGSPPENLQGIRVAGFFINVSASTRPQAASPPVTQKAFW
jgi:hypothetical protein